MKYTAKHAPNDRDDVDHEWYVQYEDGDQLIEISGLRPAEAEIFVFALNAVAENHGLLEVIGGHIQDWRAYNGPTEGVAPA